MASQSSTTRGPVLERDPVSVLFDFTARRLLERAYARPGEWTGTRLADPPGSTIAHFAAAGIDVTGPDNAPTKGGTRKLNARTRWGRAFVRALYYQHKWYSNTGSRGFRDARRMVERQAGALQVDFGRRLPATGVIPAGRAVRIRLMPGGKQAAAAARALPGDQRIFTDSGGTAGASAEVPQDRDW